MAVNVVALVIIRVPVYAAVYAHMQFLLVPTCRKHTAAQNYAISQARIYYKGACDAG